MDLLYFERGAPCRKAYSGEKVVRLS